MSNKSGHVSPCLLSSVQLGLGLQILLEWDQTFRNGEFGQTGNTVDVELAHDPLAMCFHGSDPYAETAGDFLIAEPFSNRDEYFAFTVAHLGCFWAVTATANELIDRDPSDVRTKEGFPRVDRFDSLDEFI